MKLGFLQHSLMISRMHFMLEMSARSFPNEVELVSWRQGAELRGHKVDVPETQIAPGGRQQRVRLGGARF